MEWLSHNVGWIISAATVVVVVISGWVLFGADIKQLKIDRDRQREDYRDLSVKLDKHTGETSLHIDPARDHRIWEDFQRDMSQQFEKMDKRFDSTDRKIERLMVNLPPPSSQ